MKPITGNYHSTSKLFQGVSSDGKGIGNESVNRKEEQLLEEFTKTLDKIAARLNQDLGQDISEWLTAGLQLPTGPEIRIITPHNSKHDFNNEKREYSEERKSTEEIELKENNQNSEGNSEFKALNVQQSKEKEPKPQGKSEKESDVSAEISDRTDQLKAENKQESDKSIKQNITDKEVEDNFVEEIVSEVNMEQKVISEEVTPEQIVEGAEKDIVQTNLKPTSTKELKIEESSKGSVKSEKEQIENISMTSSDQDSQQSITEKSASDNTLLSKVQVEKVKSDPKDILNQVMLLLSQDFSKGITNNQASQITQAAISKTTELGAIKQLGNSANNSQQLLQNNSGGWGGSQNIKERADSQRAQNSNSSRVPLKNFERVESVLKEAAKARDGKTISLRLDPPELGSVKVDVTIKEGGLHARLTADSASVTGMLRDRAHELQLTLRKLGLNVEKVTVSVANENAFEFISDTGTGSFSHDAHKESNTKESEKQSSGFGDVAEGSLSINSGVTVEDQILDHWIA